MADLSAYTVRTDLALEARELASEARKSPEIPGVVSDIWEDGGMRITQIQVLNDEGAQAIGKMPGQYMTIEVPDLRKKIRSSKTV